MQMKSVDIKNYRSLGDVRIEFRPTCRVLVGINESGKTNILEALALLDPGRKSNRLTDEREPVNEPPVKESFVDFNLLLEPAETLQALKNFELMILNNDISPIVSFDGRTLNIKELFTLNSEITYRADILKDNKYFRENSKLDSFILMQGWLKPKDACPPNIMVEVGGASKPLNSYKLVRDLTNENENLEEINLDYLAKIIDMEKATIAKTKLPKVAYWVYEEKNVMPNRVKIDDFAVNPESCAPLKNMFLLHKVVDIKKTIDEERKRGDNAFYSFLDRVAQESTSHFQEVWKDYKDIEFSLKPNGDFIIPGIKEVNIRDFARRSDGFKRFVSFLLLISVNVKTKDLKDSLLLIDEPDISLHPSGSRYLMEELIKISESNLVVYSTHSIFMIDQRNIERHYIVKKKKELTEIASATEDNFIDEEVLYNSLGWSAYSVLKEKNIIFEGWRDKNIFEVMLEKASTPKKKAFKDVRISHIEGVKSVKNFAPIMELSGRRYVFVSDCDRPAIEKQNDFKKNKYFGSWFTYGELSGKSTAITGEDFLKTEYLLKKLNPLLKAQGLIKDFVEKDIEVNEGILGSIKKWLAKNGAAINVKEFIDNYKEELFRNLKAGEVKPVYNSIIDGISRQL